MELTKGKKFRAIYKGPSSDGRTNKWELICINCNNRISPPTTILSTQLIECDKCNEAEFVNYNYLIDNMKL